MGFVVGNRSAVAALNTVKENIDNGTFRPVQYAAKVALDNAEALAGTMNAVYQSRRDAVVDMLQEAGWDVPRLKATIYLWLPVPAKYNGDSGAFCTDVLESKGVMVTPGRGYGSAGEGYFRVSLSYPESVLKEAVHRIVEIST